MEAIVSWLEIKDYKEGVSLYSRYGKNEFLKNLFQSQQSDYTEKKLFEELSSLAGIQPADNTEPSQKTNTGSTISEPNQFVMTKFEHELKQIYRAIDKNRYQLFRSTSAKSRKEYAFQIISLHYRKQAIYEKMEYFREHGQLPTVRSEQPCKTD